MQVIKSLKTIVVPVIKLQRKTGVDTLQDMTRSWVYFNWHQQFRLLKILSIYLVLRGHHSQKNFNILTELQPTALRPGAEKAKPLLVLFDEIDRQDRESPLGDAGSMSIDEWQERMPAPPFTGTDGYPFVLVLDHILQPWRARSEEASALSTRSREGSYASD